MSVKCQEYREVNGIEELCSEIKDAEQLLQLKYDGIWAKIDFCDDGRYRIYSKTGQLKDQQVISQGQIVPRIVTLVGEYMYGSQWSDHPDRKGKIYIFDCVRYEEDDCTFLPYNRRYLNAQAFINWLQDPRFVMVPCYSHSKVGDLWHEVEQKESYEGLILRNWKSTYYTELVKLKRSVEDDFVVMGMEQGQGKHQGRMGALVLGQYAGDELVEVMRLGGGFSDFERERILTTWPDLKEKVVLVEGKSRFSSGALRHPNFVRIREDKRPQECILKKT